MGIPMNNQDVAIKCVSIFRFRFFSVFSGASVDTLLYHPALLKFFNENVDKLIEGLKGVENQDDPASQPAFIVS